MRGTAFLSTRLRALLSSSPPALGGSALLLGLITLAFLASVGGVLVRTDTTSNLYVLQADAFLRGHLAIGHQLKDVAVSGGQYFVPFPPMPAFLLTPVVAVLGRTGANTIAFCLLLTLLNVLLLARVLRAAGIAEPLRPWILVAFFFGTGYWYSLERADGVWHVAHIVAVTFLLLAMVEAIGRGRAPLVGLLLGGAFLSRQFTLLLAPFFLALLWEHGPRPRELARSSVVGLFGVLGACVAVYLLYNYARFGSPLDTGYGNEHLIRRGSERLRVENYGLFSPAYLPRNLYYFFVQGPDLHFTAMDRVSGPERNLWGTALPAASPFLFVALYVGWRGRMVLMSWLSIGTITLCHLLYQNNGWFQINTQRFSLDYLPVLLMLVGLGLQHEYERQRHRMWQGLILYAVSLNLVFVAFFDTIGLIIERWVRLF